MFDYPDPLAALLGTLADWPSTNPEPENGIVVPESGRLAVLQLMDIRAKEPFGFTGVQAEGRRLLELQARHTELMLIACKALEKAPKLKGRA
ncbi:hypothetical protein JCM8547_008723 [Rhodosporidiobolus lusitaniae]